MADTLSNVVLPVGVWVDLYDATGLTVGTQIQVQNIGGVTVLLHTGATQPSAADGYNILRPESLTFVSQTAPTGAWARAERANGLLNVGASA